MTIESNGAGQDNTVGALIQGAAGTSVDLGKLGDLGGNTLRANGKDATSYNLLLTVPAALLVSAVGNTWTPSVQGADATGKYTVSGAGAKLDQTGPSMGRNYRLQAASVLRLAENP